jgi:hypothetical protein
MQNASTQGSHYEAPPSLDEIMAERWVAHNAARLVSRARRRGNRLPIETATAAVVAVHMLQGQKENIRRGHYRPLNARERSLLRIILNVHTLTTGADNRRRLLLLGLADQAKPARRETEAALPG